MPSHNPLYGVAKRVSGASAPKIPSAILSKYSGVVVSIERLCDLGAIGTRREGQAQRPTLISKNDIVIVDIVGAKLAG